MLPSSVDASLPTRTALPTARIGAVLEVIICSGFPTQLLLIAVLRGFGMPIQSADGGLNPQFVFSVSLLDAGLVIGLVLLFLRAHHESAREVLLGRVRMLREALVGIAMIPLAFFIVVLIMAIVLTYVPQLHNVLNNPLEDMLKTRTDAAVFAVVVMISGGVREEVQRGFIVHRFGQYLGGGALGVLVYSALFGLGHLEQGYDAMIATATLGAFWGFVYLRRGSIIAPVVSHAGFNLAQVLKHLALR
ncbi:MAG: CPBP family intramembrane metalloprotease [Acidobacteria bacterium]|nr:CPBP family intramembrane metalloprotease [Acidobacteriota bacterium]